MCAHVKHLFLCKAYVLCQLRTLPLPGEGGPRSGSDEVNAYGMHPLVCCAQPIPAPLGPKGGGGISISPLTSRRDPISPLNDQGFGPGPKEEQQFAITVGAHQCVRPKADVFRCNMYGKRQFFNLPLEALEMSVCPVGTCPEGAKRMEAGSETRIWHGSAKDDD